DVVARRAAQHHVVARAGDDGVGAAVGVLRGFNGSERERQARELRRADRGRENAAAVADHQVHAVSGIHLVAEAPADDDVLSGTGGDDVRPAAHGGGGRDDLVDVGGIGVGAGVTDFAVVTEDDVAAFARIDGVAFVAAQHDVVARARGDAVHAAVVELGGLHRAQRDREARELRRILQRGADAAAVADHQVLTVAGTDNVVEAPADDDVLAGAGGDAIDAAAQGGGSRNDLVD